MQLALTVVDVPAAKKYERRGGNDDCLPFNSGNIATFVLRTRGPITSQTAPFAMNGILSALPSPFAEHLTPSRDATPITRAALVEKLVGHMARNLGGVCNIARDASEAAEDVEALLAWLGPRAVYFSCGSAFNVGACWSFAYCAFATGKCVLFLFLQID